MSRIAYCAACAAEKHGVKSRIALEHTCGIEINRAPIIRNETTIDSMNEVIALFMEATKDSMQYHSSWDWLMPVVAKIKVLIRDAEYGKRIQMSQRLKPIQNEMLNVDLGNTHYCVYQFIQWYNK